MSDDAKNNDSKTFTEIIINKIREDFKTATKIPVETPIQLFPVQFNELCSVNQILKYTVTIDINIDIDSHVQQPPTVNTKIQLESTMDENLYKTTAFFAFPDESYSISYVLNYILGYYKFGFVKSATNNGAETYTKNYENNDLTPLDGTSNTTAFNNMNQIIEQKKDSIRQIPEHKNTTMTIEFLAKKIKSDNEEKHAIHLEKIDIQSTDPIPDNLPKKNNEVETPHRDRDQPEIVADSIQTNIV